MSSDLHPENIDVLCKYCGQTLTRFLTEMAEHNSKVVCPACGKDHDHGSSNLHASAAAE